MRRFLLSFAFLGVATIASAQQVGAGWSAFTGCWTPVSANGDRNMAANIPRVCVVPNGANSAELLTIVNDSITGRSPIDASGQRRDVSRQGCSGWEKAEFSADGRRLYLTGEQTCSGGLKRKTSGVFALTTTGDWVNAVDVSADSVSSVRVSRYATSSVSPTMPAEIRTALENREVSDRTARISAQREVSVDAVIEASKYLSAPVIEAWIAELDQDFNLNEKELVRLADANVAPSVIDVMVAVSNPRQFSVRSTGSVSRNEDSVRVRRDPYAPCFAPVIDPWAWYPYDPCDPYLRYSYYRPLYGRYGYPYGYGYGRGYGYGGYYDPYYGSPVIIVSGGNRSHGRMTKDGYKSDPSSSTGSASGSSSGGRTATSSSSGDKGSSGSSSSGGSSGSSGSSSSGGRTATRKPPTPKSEYQPSQYRPEPIERAPTSRAPIDMTTRSSEPVSTASSSASTGSSSSSGGDGGRVATRKPPA